MAEKITSNLDMQGAIADLRAEIRAASLRDGTNPGRTTILKYGTTSATSTSGTDLVVDTGVSGFKNALLAGGITKLWPQTHWTFKLRGWYWDTDGAGHIRLNINLDQSTDQTFDVIWWAIGY